MKLRIALPRMSSPCGLGNHSPCHVAVEAEQRLAVRLAVGYLIALVQCGEDHGEVGHPGKAGLDDLR